MNEQLLCGILQVTVEIFQMSTGKMQLHYWRFVVKSRKQSLVKGFSQERSIQEGG